MDAISQFGFASNNHRPRLIVTHDIDTSKGLERALSFKTVEERLGVKSIWFIPSSEYKIDHQIARDLGSDAPIGSHDVKHDGKLIGISKKEELVSRLAESRHQLEEIFEKEVDSFRSPLLQFNDRILRALVEAGYTKDFSLPCWEPVNPSVMGGFGIECANPLAFDSLIETPLTLFQDHQMLYVQELSTSEAIKLWLEQAEFLASVGGDIVLLTHPEYAFSEDLPAYGGLLEELGRIVQRHVQTSQPVGAMQ